jgi:hypothetical protein
MTKSKSLINAKPHKERKVMVKKVTRKMNSVERTYKAQLAVDPGLEMRRNLFMSRPISIYDNEGDKK